MNASIRSLQDVLSHAPGFQIIRQHLGEQARLQILIEQILPPMYHSMFRAIRRNSTTLTVSCVHTTALSQGRLLAPQWLERLRTLPEGNGLKHIRFLVQPVPHDQRNTSLPKRQQFSSKGKVNALPEELARFLRE